MERMQQSLYAKPTTALMVVKGGKLVYTYGDISRVSHTASVRKSVLSTLYGKYVASGVIDLNKTIGELGIDENGEGLLPIERAARVRDLLTSSSGVYRPTGSPSGSAAVAPPRGTKSPGSFFYYNNWDFNVAGVIFQQLTGKSVVSQFEGRRLCWL